jgi:hypothetical protein
MAEIREKRLVAALRKRAVTLLARALRKAPGDPDKLTSQLSCSLLLETWRASFRGRITRGRGRRGEEVPTVSKGNSGRERIEPRDRRERAKGRVPVRAGTLATLASSQKAGEALGGRTADVPSRNS